MLERRLSLSHRVWNAFLTKEALYLQSFSLSRAEPIDLRRSLLSSFLVSDKVNSLLLDNGETSIRERSSLRSS